MYVWLKEQSTGDFLVAFDPPEDLDDWMVLTTRQMHYVEISKELMKQASMYEAEKDFKSARVAKDLATNLTKQSKVN